MADFVADLRRLAEFCNFGDTLEKMIRDRLVCGINDAAIQKKLLAEAGLTYERALTMAQGLETAMSDLREMRTPTVHVKEEVHSVKPHGKCQDDSGTTCGSTPGYVATQCWFKD